MTVISKLGVTFVGDSSGAGESLSIQAIPEPATLAMIGIFGGGIFAIRRMFGI